MDDNRSWVVTHVKVRRLIWNVQSKEIEANLSIMPNFFLVAPVIVDDKVKHIFWNFHSVQFC